MVSWDPSPARCTTLCEFTGSQCIMDQIIAFYKTCKIQMMCNLSVKNADLKFWVAFAHNHAFQVYSDIKWLLFFFFFLLLPYDWNKQDPTEQNPKEFKIEKFPFKKVLWYYHLLGHRHLGAKRWVNSLWPGDAKWSHITGSTLAQVIACYLMTPSHYLNQC